MRYTIHIDLNDALVLVCTKNPIIIERNVGYSSNLDIVICNFSRKYKWVKNSLLLLQFNLCISVYYMLLYFNELLFLQMTLQKRNQNSCSLFHRINAKVQKYSEH